VLERLSSDTQNVGLPKDTWRKVVEAIEDAIPLYDHVNELISFGRAQKARLYAIKNLGTIDGAIVLDSGIGPGTTSKLILSKFRPKLLVGLDESVKQLTTAKQNLGEVDGNSTEMVRGSFEYLPFRDGGFNVTLTCYALRDSLSISQAIDEYHRVCHRDGVFADVDIGKPDNFLKRAFSVIYVKHVMPLIAHIAVRKKMKANPWRMIGPTYSTLPTNRSLLEMFRLRFCEAELKEFLSGGVIVILTRNVSSNQ
jgi:demethylmenaquinone methyltransferase/2-methoxy-6-polyprenyl-1,4-benzoquinol methylase